MIRLYTKTLISLLLVLLFLSSFSQVNVSILGPADTVAQFNKIEFGVQLPEWINQSVDAFLNKGKGVNPFDPEQVSIEGLCYSGNFVPVLIKLCYNELILPGFHFMAK